MGLLYSIFILTAFALMLMLLFGMIVQRLPDLRGALQGKFRPAGGGVQLADARRLTRA
jgi:hypothetical protein